jgi:hypothetical protein
MYDLSKSTKYEDSEFLERFASFDSDLAEKLLLGYMNRCSFKHALAFF